MKFLKKKIRETTKEVSILITYCNEDNEFFMDEKKIGFNDSLQIDIKPEMRVLRINISSFEVIKT